MPLPALTAVIKYEPVGVVAAVTPWNYPLLMVAWKGVFSPLTCCFPWAVLAILTRPCVAWQSLLLSLPGARWLSRWVSHSRAAAPRLAR